jgi:hypothetical protein
MAGASSLVTIEGWEAPCYQVMQTPPTFYGVPMGFFVADALGSLLLAPYWWPSLVVGLGLYGIACLGTQIEPHWLAIAWDYLTYNTSYEG